MYWIEYIIHTPQEIVLIFKNNFSFEKIDINFIFVSICVPMILINFKKFVKWFNILTKLKNLSNIFFTWRFCNEEYNQYFFFFFEKNFIINNFFDSHFIWRFLWYWFIWYDPKERCYVRSFCFFPHRKIKLRMIRSKQCKIKNTYQWNFLKNLNNLLYKFLLFSIITYLFISFIFYHYINLIHERHINCKLRK